MENQAFEFDNMPVKLAVMKKIPRMELAGMVVDETEANKEITTRLWVAWELVEAGLARFANDTIKAEEWTEIHRKERFQPPGKLSTLPDGFYSKSYFTFSRLTREARNDPERIPYLNRLRGMLRDIIESRINKITRLSSSEVVASQKDLQPEEILLFDEISKFILFWRNEIKRLGGL